MPRRRRRCRRRRRTRRKRRSNLHRERQRRIVSPRCETPLGPRQCQIVQFAKHCLNYPSPQFRVVCRFRAAFLAQPSFSEFPLQPAPSANFSSIAIQWVPITPASLALRRRCPGAAPGDSCDQGIRAAGPLLARPEGPPFLDADAELRNQRQSARRQGAPLRPDLRGPL